MKAFFNFITTLTVRFRWITIALVVVMMGLGATSATQLNQELLPPIAFPQTVILGQANGMTSEQVSTVLTQQIEAQVSEIEDIVNVESETTGTFGTTIIAYNDFGLNQDALVDEIRVTMNAAWHPDVNYTYTEGDFWLPLRGVGTLVEENQEALVSTLMADLTPDVLIYLASQDANFLFQLSPDVWASFSEETQRTLLGYLATTTEAASSGGSVLERLVEAEVVPQLEAIPEVASVDTQGGQSLNPEEAEQNIPDEAAATLLLRLSPEVWEIISPTVDLTGPLDQSAVDTIQNTGIDVPSVSEPPSLPESWQADPRFSTPDDLLEITTITQSIGTVFNDLYEQGYVIGALGQTDDLNASIITNMLALETAAGVPLEESLLNYFTGQHLAAMPQEAFDALPEAYLDNLDNITAQQLESRTEETQATPIDLPGPWSIPAPQILTFSSADFPLATFSISSVGEIVLETDEVVEQEETEVTAPSLPGTFGQLAGELGVELNTADDLLALELPEDFASVLPEGSQAANLLNFLVTPEIPEGVDAPEGFDEQQLDLLAAFGPGLVGSISDEAIQYLIENDPEFEATLSDETSTLLFAQAEEGDIPTLNPQWNVLAGFDPNFDALDTADDLVGFPDDFAYEDVSDFLNGIFADPGGRNFIPELIGQWPISAIAYVLEEEPTALDNINPEILRFLPEDSITLLPDELRTTAENIRTAIVPTRTVTRTNRQESLVLNVFKTSESNTVTTYAEIEELIFSLADENENIEVRVVQEQASFVVDSIEGVAREGSLGAIFAIVIILIFLSSGQWGLRGRRLTGMAMFVIFSLGLLGLVFLGLDSADSDWGQAFNNTDIVIRVLLMFGIVASLVVLAWPSDLPDPAWRATIVIAVSIPLSIMTAFVLIRWLSPAMNDLIQPLADQDGTAGEIFTFLARIFPENLTLNLLTLSGLTVAVGRVVDDSIVVLENIFRQLQQSDNKMDAVLSGTRDVSAAIFTATLIAVVVFLPLGLTGGLIGAFFLPFGLAVTYALLSSFIVAITVVPALAYITISIDDIPEDRDIWVADYYVPVLKWSLRNGVTKFIVIVIAFGSAAFGLFLLGQRPAAFLPEFGEPQITIDVEYPNQGARIANTNEGIMMMEDFIFETIPAEELISVQTTVGGAGITSVESQFGGTSVQENRANITIALDASADELEDYKVLLEEEGATIFTVDGSEEVFFAVNVGSAGGDFGGFELVTTGDPEALAAVDPLVKAAIASVDGIVNVTSNLPEANDDTELTQEEAEEAAQTETLILVNSEPALSYGAELQTENTIGVTSEALLLAEQAVTDFATGEPTDTFGLSEEQIATILAIPSDTLASIGVSQGFDSEVQSEGFQSIGVAMVLATGIIILILIFSFQSLVYWFALILSIVVAPVGAAIALTLTDRVLGISALIGLLLLLGLVITNAVVLIDRVRSNRNERGMSLYDSLVEAGGRRLRPILMTSLATIIALTPLAIGLSEGALIASELGTVVIGGVFSSTLLTLIVVPVMYSIAYPIHRLLSFGSNEPDDQTPDEGKVATGD